tara:strand:- start:118 stop:483 length:366 start_codon:yes stop_codon:yes gene_type:complete
MESINVKFKVGEIYSCNSVCDSDCRWFFRVEKRTTKTIVVTELNKDLTVNTHHQNESGRKRISVWNGEETVSPLGRFSMSPILGASDLVCQQYIEDADRFVRELKEKVANQYSALTEKGGE